MTPVPPARSGIAPIPWHSVRTALIGLCLAFVTAAPGHARADERTPLEIVVVLDTSGSMKTHDPRRLSQFAVEVLAAFLDDSDRLALVPLGAARSSPAATLPFATVAEQRTRLGAHLESLTYAGGTPCDDALRDAEKLLLSTNHPGDHQLVLFLTDGICHEGMADKGTRDDALLKIATSMATAKRRIFGLPLGPEADTNLLQSLSTLTEAGADPSPVADARQLPAQFARLSAAFRRTEARTVAFEPGLNSLPLDPYLRRVTLLATANASSLRIADIRTPTDAPAPPNTHIVGGRFPKTGAQWSGWSILRLERPEAGPWQLQVESTAAASGVIVYDYALSPRITVAPATTPAGTTPGLTANTPLRVILDLVTPEGETVSPAFVRDASARLEVREPGSQTWRDLGALTFDELGRLSQTSAFQKPGRHVLRARVRRGPSLDLTTVTAFQIGPVLVVPNAGDAANEGLHCLDPDNANTFSINLQDALGQPFAPPNDDTLDATSAFDISLWAAPGEAPLGRVALFSPDPAVPGRFEARWKPSEPGAWRYEIRLTSAIADQAGGSLDIRSGEKMAFAPRMALSADMPKGPGILRPGDSFPLRFSTTGMAIAPSLERHLDLSELQLPAGIEATAPTTAGNTTGLVLLASKDLDEPGAIHGSIHFITKGPCVPETRLGTLTLDGRAEPLSFWEKYGTLILCLLGSLAFLLYIIKVIRCRAHTAAFSDSFRIHYVTRDVTRPEKSLTRDQVRPVRRFLLLCRSQRMYWRDGQLTSHGDKNCWYLEATGERTVELVVGRGTPVICVNRQGQPLEERDQPNVTTVKNHDRIRIQNERIYKIGDVFIRRSA